MNSLDLIVLTVCFLGAAQGFVLSLSLLSVQRDRASRPGTSQPGPGQPRISQPGPRQRILGLLLFVATLALTGICLSHSGLGRGFENLLDALEFTFMGILPPLLYLYTYAETRRPSSGDRIPRSLWLHFLPVLGWLLYVVVVQTGFPQLLGLQIGEEALWPAFGPVVAYQIAYTVLAIATLAGWVSAETHSPSDPSESRVWLRGLLGSMVVVHVAQIVRMSFLEVEELRNIVPLALALAFFAVTNIGFRQSPLVRAASRRRSRVEGSIDPVRFERDRLRLLALLDDERRFLDDELSLTSLAGELGWSRTYLSTLINVGLGKSFLELINDYRLDEARRLLRDPGAEHLTIDAVASRSGFRSRSTFYEVFRRATGQTPSSYRRQQVS